MIFLSNIFVVTKVINKKQPSFHWNITENSPIPKDGFIKVKIWLAE